MILQKVRVKNVRSYESGELTLASGTTALAGDIGAGKSSLLQAMEMSLFGFAEVDASNLLRHGSNEGEVEVVFEDDGTLLSLRRSIKRRFSGGKEASPVQSCSLARDGHRASYSVTEMKSEVIKLLGFPDDPNPRSHSDLWRWAVYVPQERMREVLSQNDDERLETVRRAHGLEEYRTSRDNAQEVARELRSIEKALLRDASIYGEAAKTLGDSSAHLKEFEPRLTVLRKDLEDLRLALEAVEMKREGLRELQRRIGVAREHANGLSSRLAVLGSSIASAKKKGSDYQGNLVDLRSKLEEKTKQLKANTFTPESLTEQSKVLRELGIQKENAQKGKDQLLSAREALKTLRSGLDTDQARLARALSSFQTREESVRRLEGEVGNEPSPPKATGSLQEIEEGQRKVLAKVSETDAELGASRHSEKEVDELIRSGNCPRCGQGVDPVSFGKHLTEAREKTQGLEKQKSELTEQLRSLENQREERLRYEKSLYKWQEGRKRLDLAIAEAAWAKKEVDSLKVEVDQKTAKLAEAKGRVSELEPEEARYEKIRNAEDDSKAVLEELREEEQRRLQMEHDLLTLGESVKGVEKLIAQNDETLGGHEAEKTQTEKDLRDAMANIDSLEIEGKASAGIEERYSRSKSDFDAKTTELTKLERDVEHLREDIKKAEESVRKGREAETRAGTCKVMSDWLNLFTAAMDEVEKRRLLNIHRDFAKEFSKYFAILVEDGSMRATLDATFSPSVTIGGVPTPPEALSGGERTALALAYRLSLGHTVRAARKLRLESLILDEPTDGFSEGQITKLSDLLRELGHRQILLVSHDSGLTGIADHVVRVEKVDGKSTLS
jgi:exonuclease SbcC